MDQSATIGLDLARNVFQVHGVGTEGAVVCRRQLRRSQVLMFLARPDPCLVGMEACAGAHHWARELAGPGHVVRLMPPACVQPCVKRGKTDAVDAEAICEASEPVAQRSFAPVGRMKAKKARQGKHAPVQAGPRQRIE